MLVAHWNSLKTWLAFSMASAVASGRPWLGKFVTRRGRALILDFESGAYEVVRRLKLLGTRDGEVDDRLLRTSYPEALMTDPEAWIELASVGLDFIVLDSFNAAVPGDTNENEASAAAMLKLAGRFAEVTKCTVLVIHHARKGDGGDARETVRGSTAIYAACDRIFAFSEPEKQQETGIVMANMYPIKDGAGRTVLTIRIELSDQGLRLLEEPKPQEPSEPTPERNRKLVLQCLKANPAGVAKKDLVDIMVGNRTKKFELLANMKLTGITVEFTDRADGIRRDYVMLRPGAEI